MVGSQRYDHVVAGEIRDWYINQYCIRVQITESFASLQMDLRSWIRGTVIICGAPR